VIVKMLAVVTRSTFVVGKDTFVHRYGHDVAVAAST